MLRKGVKTMVNRVDFEGVSKGGGRGTEMGGNDWVLGFWQVKIVVLAWTHIVPDFENRL